MKIKLPTEWKIMRIQDFAEVITGGTPSTMKKEYWENGTIPWLPSGDLKNKPIKEAHTFITNEGLRNSNARMMPKQTVVIALTGATTGQTGILELEASANQSVTGILPSKEHVPKYLFYFLQSQRKKILSESYGGAQPHISQGYVKNLEVILPPIRIQEKIAVILEQTERAKEIRRTADDLTKDLLKAIFLEMFGDPIRNTKKIPLTKISHICDVKTGGTPDRAETSYWKNGTIPWVKTTEVKENTINETEEFITEEGLNNSNATIFPKNSIIIAMYGQGVTRGKVAKLGIDSATNQACAVLLPSEKYVPEYLLYFLKISYLKLRNLGRGGNQPNLNLTLVKQFDVLLPPKQLQVKFADLVKKTTELQTKQAKSRKYLDDLFDNLKQKAFNGELTC